MLRRIKRYSPAVPGISSITLAELAFGTAKSQEPARNIEALHELTATLEVVPFDDAAAHSYGAVRATLERAGTMIGSLLGFLHLPERDAGFAC